MSPSDRPGGVVPMFRVRWAMLLALVAMAFANTTLVHAFEASPSWALDCSGEVLSDTSGDRMPSSADSALPHHHGNCQTVAVAPQAASAVFEIVRKADARPRVAQWQALTSHLGDPALRPPNT